MSNPDPQPKKIIFNKYELGRLLGCGAFAKVYHARTLPRPSTTASSNSHNSTTSVAIKIISKSRVAKSNQAHHITREMSILRRLRHPHIIRLIEVLASKTKIFFVLEFAKGGELFAKISKHGRCPEDQTRKLFQQLISAVGYCHSRGVFHRDLKPENLLLDEHGDLKVTDFGLSALTDQTRADGMFHTLCGTPAYVAPEILIKNGYDGAKVDVWSCGVILYVLNAGYLPFNDPNLMNMYRKIYRGEYRVPKWTSPELKSLLSRLLDTNPQTRIRVDEILDDPWFKKGLDEKKFKTMMSFHNEEEKDEELNFEERDVNAFDLILMSRGVNLLGLFETGSEKKERFVAGLEEAEGILGKVEEVGMREGCVVKRKGQNGKLGVVMRGRNGNLVAMVVVYRLTTGGCAVVEIEKGDSRWAREFWEEKLKSVFTVGQGQVAGEGSSGDREVPVL